MGQGHFGWNINYYLTDPQDLSESCFTETLLFFPYHDISCNLSSISFISGGLISTLKKVLLKVCSFSRILTVTTWKIIYNIKSTEYLIFIVVVNP